MGTEKPVVIDSTVVAYRWRHVGAVMTGEGHTWVGDEPRAVGGDGTGPSPFCQLNGSLADCTVSTLAARSRLEGIGLNDCAVIVNCLVGTDARGIFTNPHELPTLADEENFDCRIKKMTRRIRVTGELSEPDVARLLEFANACPVSETLAAAVPIRTTIEHVESVRDDT